MPRPDENKDNLFDNKDNLIHIIFVIIPRQLKKGKYKGIPAKLISHNQLTNPL